MIIDASLLFGLLNATVDWALANAQSLIDFSVANRLELSTMPTSALRA